MNRNFLNDKDKTNPKLNMKDENCDPKKRDWEAFIRKLEKDLQAKNSKMFACIKLYEVSDLYHREELIRDIKNLRNETLELLLESFKSVVPTANYKIIKEDNIHLN